MSSFIGYVPAEDPALVILVVIDYAAHRDLRRRRRRAGLPRHRRVRSRRAAASCRAPTPRRAVDRRSRAAARPSLRGRAPIASSEIAAPGGVPSFLGLSMREALVRAQSEGWLVRVEGSGYVDPSGPAARRRAPKSAR